MRISKVKKSVPKTRTRKKVEAVYAFGTSTQAILF